MLNTGLSWHLMIWKWQIPSSKTRNMIGDKVSVSMVTISDEILEKLKRFLSMVSDSGLHIERAILFGSYAKGTENTWSDIDIALVSKDFTGIGFYDRKRVNPFLIKVDSRIEPHPFKPEDFTEDNPMVREILKQGIEIS